MPYRRMEVRRVNPFRTKYLAGVQSGLLFSFRSFSRSSSIFVSADFSRLYSQYWRLVPPLAIGFGIGWCYKDVTVTLNGNSMSPTLASGERVLLIPSYILRLRHDLFPQYFSTIVEEGDVIIVRISANQLVCKRVKKIWTNKSAMIEWEQERFSSPEEYLHQVEAYDDAHFHIPSKETCKVNDSSAASNVPSTAKTELPPLPTKPFRAFQWDPIRDAASSTVDRQSNQWIWLEGDNHAESFDSRKAGSLPATAVYGKVIAVLTPKLRLLQTT